MLRTIKSEFNWQLKIQKINKFKNIINLEEEEEKLILENQFNKISHKHHRQNLKKKIKTDIEKSKCTFYKTKEDKNVIKIK